MEEAAPSCRPTLMRARSYAQGLQSVNTLTYTAQMVESSRADKEKAAFNEVHAHTQHAHTSHAQPSYPASWQRRRGSGRCFISSVHIPAPSRLHPGYLSRLDLGSISARSRS